ncbi:MAG: 5'-nucleotidase, lipoprotein e(P4) family [Gammaproteobacteria bacterium]|tara:strand:+ start:1842 stop:2690 length:849 start_codon:yes stop_codon:yes gene_type:complete
MKARLWQTLFILNALIASEIILAEDANKDVRDLKEQNIMSVLFQQTAAERLAGSLQTFKSAKQALDNALADSSWSALPGQNVHGKKPAIIVDVDETVLDNTAYEARMILDGTKYPEGWVSWGKEAAATEVPGAKDFLNYAASKDVTIFYVTNRVVELKEATKKNLTKLGIPWDKTKDTVLMRGENNWGSDKGPRRTLVGNEYRVLLMIGDNLGDFVDAKDNNLNPSNRKNIVSDYADYWGVQWFMLQNIAYGDWEGALYDFNYSLSPDEVYNSRLEFLDPAR